MERDKEMKVVDAPLLQPRCPPKMWRGESFA